LDSLPPTDPRAKRSRRDLRVINRFMRNPTHLWNAIQRLEPAPASILEWGTGDGTLMLEMARRAKGRWNRSPRFFLLDKEPVVSGTTLASFEKLGCDVELIRADLNAWTKRNEPIGVDLIVANLFLHHFTNEELRALFSRCASSARAFIACEPRRWTPGLIATRLLWLIGCNSVTRNDAYISVRAGFRDRELSELWDADSHFDLSEYPGGYASHLFVASRAGAAGL
jgi:hypothetical protein